MRAAGALALLPAYALALPLWRATRAPGPLPQDKLQAAVDGSMAPIGAALLILALAS
eukprot:SM000002S05506  [mRNA]  locus=s2:270466:270636:- [translate_table: standard]